MSRFWIVDSRLSFFNDLHQKLGAPGDFAQAYVLAHEVGHHVQNLTGTLDSAPFTGNANERSVRVELQADCYAGVWGHEAAKPGRFAAGRVELDPGDVEEGLNAAAAELTGFTHREPLASSVFDITPPVEEKDVALLWRAFLRTGRQGDEIVIRRRDGSQISGRYMAATNLIPGVHVSVMAKI